MSYSNAYCGAIKGYQTKTITGYETTSAVNVFRQPCSLYEIYIRISAAIVFAADLRVFIWDYNPPGNTVLPAPVLGNSKLVMMSGTLLASDMFFWEPPSEGWKQIVTPGQCIESVRYGYPFDQGIYVQVVETQPGTPIADAANLYVSARFLT